MRKILGIAFNYHDQTNDATVEFTKDYTSRRRIVACGANSAAMGFEIGNYPKEPFGKGVQWSDHIMMLLHNKFNLNDLLTRRKIDTDKYPPNEIPQFYPEVADILFGEGKHGVEFSWGHDYESLKQLILNECTVQIGGGFPCGGHFVQLVGFDDTDSENRKLIINDPYPPNYKDGINGYNREITEKWYKEHISDYKVVYPKWK